MPRLKSGPWPEWPEGLLKTDFQLEKEKRGTCLAGICGEKAWAGTSFCLHCGLHGTPGVCLVFEWQLKRLPERPRQRGLVIIQKDVHADNKFDVVEPHGTRGGGPALLATLPTMDAAVQELMQRYKTFQMNCLARGDSMALFEYY